MIVKKIPAHRDSRHVGIRRAKHARDLVDYMRSPEKESPLREHLVAYMAKKGIPDGPERLIHIGARNFVSQDLDGQRAEMMALAQAAVRTPNPIDHWLLSWQEGEIPTAKQVDEVVDMFVDRLGMAKHQVIYAVHGDTHNRHCHIALNRYDAPTGKVITIHKGFFREASHRVVAEIVAHFGWKAEPNARYEWLGGEAVLSEVASLKVAEGLKPLRAGASLFEVQTGYRSAQRLAQDHAWPLIRDARSWEELHAGLATHGMSFDAVGTNGATIAVGDERVKASDVSRYASIGKLKKRLGDFCPRSADVVITHRKGSDRFPGAFRADELRQLRHSWETTTPEERLVQGLQRPPADLETYLHEQGEHHSAETWRQGDRDVLGETVFEAVHSPCTPFIPEIDGYVGRKCAEGVRYARKGEGTAFVDKGSEISVLPGSDEALLAALRLAVRRFDGHVRVKGNDAIQDRIWRLAIEHGLTESLVSRPPPSIISQKVDVPVANPDDVTVVTTANSRPSAPTIHQDDANVPPASAKEGAERHRKGGPLQQAQVLRPMRQPNGAGSPIQGVSPTLKVEPENGSRIVQPKTKLSEQASRLLAKRDGNVEAKSSNGVNDPRQGRKPPVLPRKGPREALSQVSHPRDKGNQR